VLRGHSGIYEKNINLHAHLKLTQAAKNGKIKEKDKGNF